MCENARTSNHHLLSSIQTKKPRLRSMSSEPFLEILAHRRTMYDLSNETTIPDSKVVHVSALTAASEDKS
jgi:hypothetical protein